MSNTVLALDVALCNTGAVVFQYKKKWKLIHTEVIRTKKENKKRGIYVVDDEVRRIQFITSALDQLDVEFEPDAIIAELPTGGALNAKAAAAMAMGKTIVAVFAKLYQIPLITVTPTDVKREVTGKAASYGKGVIKEAAAELYPHLRKEYASKTSKDGWNGVFEHVADAIFAFRAASNNPVIMSLGK